MSYTFGPVPSRRLGRSLGVDTVPFKTCTYDCIYCQLGRTTCKTIERREWVPLDEVVSEVKDKLSTRPDYITLSGSGEPTLFSRMGELIDRIKGMTDIPVAVLTNGSLLWQDEVRRELYGADLLVPSLDAGDVMRFRHINRPHEAISFEQMLSGLIALRQAFRGEYWLEMFLLAGYTDIESEVRKLVQCVELIKPDRVQLNTVARPPAESFAEGVTREHLEKLAAMFDPPAEVIADFQGIHEESEFAAGRGDILDMLRRRPCSVQDVVSGIGLHVNEVVKYLEDLCRQGLVEQTVESHGVYYRALRASGQPAEDNGG